MSFTTFWTKGKLLASCNKNKDPAPENLSYLTACGAFTRNILHSTFKFYLLEKEALTCEAHILGDERQDLLQVILPTGMLS